MRGCSRERPLSRGRGACRAWRRAETPPTADLRGLSLVLRKGCLVSRPPAAHWRRNSPPRAQIQSQVLILTHLPTLGVFPPPFLMAWGLCPSRGQDLGWGASGGVTHLLTGTLSWKNAGRKRRWQSAQLLPRPPPTPFPADSPRASPWTLKAAAQCPIRLVPRLPLSWLISCPYPARPPEGTTSCPGLLFLLLWSPPC